MTTIFCFHPSGYSVALLSHYGRFGVFLSKIGMHVKTVQIEFFAIEIIIKGQLISKCPYEKSVWTKYQQKYF